MVENVVDLEFVSWFRLSFHDSPRYRWEYIDPVDGEAKFEWDFAPQHRLGYANGVLIKQREYASGVYEECYDEAIIPYDNSAAATP